MDCTAEFSGALVRQAFQAARQARDPKVTPTASDKALAAEAIGLATGLEAASLALMLEVLEAVGDEVDDLLHVRVFDDAGEGEGIRMGGHRFEIERAQDEAASEPKAKRTRKPRKPALPELVKIVKAADRAPAPTPPAHVEPVVGVPVKHEIPKGRGRFTVDGKLVEGPRAGWTGPVPKQRFERKGPPGARSGGPRGMTPRRGSNRRGS